MPSQVIWIAITFAAALILFVVALPFLFQGKEPLDAQAARTALTACCTAFVSPVPNLCVVDSIKDKNNKDVSIIEYECSGVPREFSGSGILKISELYNIANGKQKSSSVSGDDIKGRLGCGCPSLAE